MHFNRDFHPCALAARERWRKRHEIKRPPSSSSSTFSSSPSSSFSPRLLLLMPLPLPAVRLVPPVRAENLPKVFFSASPPLSVCQCCRRAGNSGCIPSSSSPSPTPPRHSPLPRNSKRKISSACACERA